ncbi:MAG: ABC transporter ATP-binding protein [Rhodospirillales bacterium]
MIVLDRLTRTFGPLTAVDGISLEVNAGEVLGFLGPNGAGKTTTMRMIAGYLEPSAGRVEVCGFDLARKPIEAKRRIGYLPEGAPLYGDMTARRFLAFVAEVRGFDGAERRRRIDRVAEMVSLEDALDRPIDTLSKGFKRRVGLAQALLHDPPVRPRRADRRSRSQPEAPGAHPDQPHGGGQGDHHLDPHPRGGGGGVQPGGDHRRGPAGRRRHRRGAAAPPARARFGGGRRRRRRCRRGRAALADLAPDHDLQVAEAAPDLAMLRLLAAGSGPAPLSRWRTA